MVTDPDPSRENDSQGTEGEMVTEKSGSELSTVTNEGGQDARDPGGDSMVTGGSAGDVGTVTKDDYTVAKWKGLTVWQCAHCAYDTLAGEGDMIKHIRQRHKPRIETVTLPLVDAKGDAISKEVILWPEQA